MLFRMRALLSGIMVGKEMIPVARSPCDTLHYNGGFACPE